MNIPVISGDPKELMKYKAIYNAVGNCGLCVSTVGIQRSGSLVELDWSDLHGGGLASGRGWDSRRAEDSLLESDV